MKEMADTNKADAKAAEKEAKASTAALDAAKTQIEREFGAGSLMTLSGDDALEVEAIPTGALSLDLALGVGGVPRGRVVEIFGPESSGKTTLVYHIMAEAQARGGVCAFIDAEHALDPIYARRIGAQHGRAPDLPARLRRAGARDRRRPRPLRARSTSSPSTRSRR